MEAVESCHVLVLLKGKASSPNKPPPTRPYAWGINGTLTHLNLEYELFPHVLFVLETAPIHVLFQRIFITSFLFERGSSPLLLDFILENSYIR